MNRFLQAASGNNCRSKLNKHACLLQDRLNEEEEHNRSNLKGNVITYNTTDNNALIWHFRSTRTEIWGL